MMKLLRDSGALSLIKSRIDSHMIWTWVTHVAMCHVFDDDDGHSCHRCNMILPWSYPPAIPQPPPHHHHHLLLLLISTLRSLPVWVFAWVVAVAFSTGAFRAVVERDGNCRAHPECIHRCDPELFWWDQHAAFHWHLSGCHHRAALNDLHCHC